MYHLWNIPDLHTQRHRSLSFRQFDGRSEQMKQIIILMKETNGKYCQSVWLSLKMWTASSCLSLTSWNLGQSTYPCFLLSSSPQNGHTIPVSSSHFPLTALVWNPPVTLSAMSFCLASESWLNTDSWSDAFILSVGHPFRLMSSEKATSTHRCDKTFLISRPDVLLISKRTHSPICTWPSLSDPSSSWPFVGTSTKSMLVRMQEWRQMKQPLENEIHRKWRHKAVQATKRSECADDYKEQRPWTAFERQMHAI